MMTRQEMDALVGKTLIIRDFPHICLAAGNDALLLLQIAARDESILRELGYKLNFEAVSNYAGNAFCEKSWDMIEKSNPFNIADRKNGSQAMSNLAGFFGKSSIRIMGGKTK